MVGKADPRGNGKSIVMQKNTSHPLHLRAARGKIPKEMLLSFEELK
jgi:hypothetical protein